MDNDDFLASAILSMTDEELEAFCKAVEENERSEHHD